jgi:hypothetical protein
VAASPVTVPITITIPPSPQPTPTPPPQPTPTPPPQPTPTPSPQPTPTPQPIVSTNALAFTTTAGTNPAAQTINVQNPGGNTLTWTVGTPSATWLAVSPTTGSDTIGQSTPLTFTIDITGMTTGTYTATVLITPSVGAPVTVNVTLTIQ